MSSRHSRSVLLALKEKPPGGGAAVNLANLRRKTVENRREEEKEWRREAGNSVLFELPTRKFASWWRQGL